MKSSCTFFPSCSCVFHKGSHTFSSSSSPPSLLSMSSSSSSSSSDYTPGTNIYIAVWAAFIASLRVTVKWKEARAIRFAQTSGAKSEDEEEEEEDDDIDNNDGGEEEEERV